MTNLRSGRENAGFGVIGIFPTIDSWVRLETCYLTEYSED